MATVSFSIPILSIPLYYLLAILPHGYAISKASQGDLKKHDNRNPRGSTQLENIKKRLTPKEFAAFERGESCHRNHLENMPLYVATLFAGMLAENRVGEGELGLINFVVGWMVIRTLYTVNYLATEQSQGWTQVRSLLYFLGTGWSFLILGRAAFALA
ncbi:hypothetical protein CLAFUW4_12022 [Fulvia fulva]|uniref:Uncharacterized protein n=1 Tax=Passalora fulva TaxID=5499 RepID=A0A9Q8PED7_PASFU|nr:uncharacterized protein CLAFUR5_11061 [Fulvia fulva]KAK4617829.1 hypothetical protein CLAFUR4_12027 [Fulvia fulva]KAK4618649.1 hypothetical protein CLAFUR0_12038 [Fulvia fulva]UJO20896.1 hypothetical protein CLAFUR5_11061 [Fulvia fulva]WPV18512.1 hypothetical protein CLAFUW4_12022 [Fulvia fulva]WPV33468.1 hypothetical protein CLAFUW7_12029 [Fulvia fulva]